MITIEESGMSFGPYSPGSVFQIEQSPAVQARLSPNGIKVCEFIWCSPKQNLFLVEAKSTVPNPRKSPEAYALYFSQIIEKFSNSIHILAAGLTARNSSLQHEINTAMSIHDFASVSDIRFYLVIPDAPDAAVQHLSDKLGSLLKRQRLIWKADAKVINRRFAQKAGLIQ